MRRRRRGADVGNDLMLTCDTAGIAYIASTQAYGTWEFDVNKGAEGNTSKIAFISSTVNPYPNTNGYHLIFLNNEGFNLTRINDDSSYSDLFITDISYIDNNIWYRIKIERTGDGTFTVYIKGGDFGWDDWTTVVADSGSNPATDNVHTTSAYFVADLNAGDKIGVIHTTDGNLDVRDFTVSTGAFTTGY